MIAEQTFVPLPETMPVLSIGLLGVTVPTEWGMCLSTAQWNFMRDMRMEEIERRILAIEAASGMEARQGGNEVPCEARQPDGEAGTP